MPVALDVLSLVLGLALGAGSVFLYLRVTLIRTTAEWSADRADLAARLEVATRAEADLRTEIVQRDARLADATVETARERERVVELTVTLDKERAATIEKLATLDEARTKLSDAFKALGADALARNNEGFLSLARETLAKYQERAFGDLEKRQAAIGELVTPFRQSLDKMGEKIQQLETARAGAYEGLKQQVVSLMEAQNGLRAETGNLVRALRTPSARGRWGEIQLKRVVEMAGMLDHCDFFEQVAVDEGRLRPDLVVRLPGGKTIVVDAKTPLEGYLDGVQAADDQARRDGLVRHARHVREHMRQLGAKAYWSQFEATPEFVVLFLPGENFFSAALEHDPALIEAGIDHGVILATPTTLIALLRAVAYGWRQERLAENARDISALGAELHKRVGDFLGHMERLGGQLDKAVDSYNKAVGSLETRVLVTARRFRDLDAASDAVELSAAGPIERSARAIQAPELAPPS